MAPDACLFIDDLEVNVTAARALGWQAILYHPGLDLEEALADCGVRLDEFPMGER